MKYAELHLPYFKQGDDLAYHLKRASSVGDALEAHARQLEHAADILRRVKAAIGERDISFSADTHVIAVSGDDDVIDALLNAKLAEAPPWEEWDEEDEERHEEESEWDAIF
jgi:hypothetical protein